MSSIDDIKKAKTLKNIEGIIVGKAIYDGDIKLEDRTIDSHVKRIRKKFKKVDEKFSAIETRYGSGYRWNVS